MALNLRIKPRKRLLRSRPQALAVPAQMNEVWSMDFMHDKLFNGRSIRLFNVIDVFNRKRLIPCYSLIVIEENRATTRHSSTLQKQFRALAQRFPCKTTCSQGMIKSTWDANTVYQIHKDCAKVPKSFIWLLINEAFSWPYLRFCCHYHTVTPLFIYMLGHSLHIWGTFNLLVW